MNEIADVIIIGGGVQGTSLAFHLAEKGVKPIVLERRFLAAEASGRSSGLVRMHYDVECDARLAWISFQYFRNWESVWGEIVVLLAPGSYNLFARSFLRH
jgi:sarcosine oxidase subunit beta